MATPSCHHLGHVGFGLSGNWTVWSHFVFSGAEDARDRCAGGAGCHAKTGVIDDHDGRAAIRSAGAGHGLADGDDTDPRAKRLAGGCEHDVRADLGRHGGGITGRGGARLLRASTTCGARGPYGGTEVRLTR